MPRDFFGLHRKCVLRLHNGECAWDVKLWIGLALE